MFDKLVVIDGKGHLLGRLCATIAKELLKGQRVVVVRCEEIEISGSLFRNKLKYNEFLRKRTNTNPTRGPFHFKAPSKILWRVLRGMLPHKTTRGKCALARFKSYEGVPHPFDKMKKLCIPFALRYLRLKPGRSYTRVGDMAQQVGWKHSELITKLETKRKTRAAAWYQTKKQLNKVRAQAVKNVSGELNKIAAPLALLGHPIA